MRTYKAGVAPELPKLKALLKKAIQDHYDGLPVTRGLAFESDSEHRFWGENSQGVYCARFFDQSPRFEDLENLRQEFLKLRSAFLEGVDFIVFFLRETDDGFDPETIRRLFSEFKSVRFVWFTAIVSPLGECSLLVEDALRVEKRLEPVENPLPELSLAWQEEGAEYRVPEMSLPGPAALTKQEIESFFEIGVEMKRAAHLKRLAS